MTTRIALILAIASLICIAVVLLTRQPVNRDEIQELTGTISTVQCKHFRLSSRLVLELTSTGGVRHPPVTASVLKPLRCDEALLDEIRGRMAIVHRYDDWTVGLVVGDRVLLDMENYLANYESGESLVMFFSLVAGIFVLIAIRQRFREKEELRSER